MKIIVSHDIDHITAWEHKNALIPKFIIRSSIELFSGVISVREYMLRFKRIFIENRWQNIDDLMAFDLSHNIPSSFFVGMANGVGLEYSIEKAYYWADRIYQKGFDVGVHGIAYDDIEQMRNEHMKLCKKLNISDIGIRMHYLRNDKKTFTHLSNIGYLYDSTELKDENPYKIGEMWEFPLHIMEGNIFYQNGKRWTSLTLEEYKDISINRIEELENKSIKYMTLLFHDRYYDDSFTIWKKWYEWVVMYLKDKGHTFISYKDAIKELTQ